MYFLYVLASWFINKFLRSHTQLHYNSKQCVLLASKILDLILLSPQKINDGPEF